MGRRTVFCSNSLGSRADASRINTPSRIRQRNHISKPVLARGQEDSVQGMGHESSVKKVSLEFLLSHHS